MPLSQSKLATELEAMEPAGDELTAIQNFATAFNNYFKDATAGVPAIPATLDPAKSAMVGAMTGLSITGAAAIQAGITAYWGVVALSGATIWILVPPIAAVTPPPGLGGLVASLAAAFTANTVGALDLIASAAAIAAAIHSTQSGALALITPPPPNVTVPIV